MAELGIFGPQVSLLKLLIFLQTNGHTIFFAFCRLHRLLLPPARPPVPHRQRAPRGCCWRPRTWARSRRSTWTAAAPGPRKAERSPGGRPSTLSTDVSPKNLNKVCSLVCTFSFFRIFLSSCSLLTSISLSPSNRSDFLYFLHFVSLLPSQDDLKMICIFCML